MRVGVSVAVGLDVTVGVNVGDGVTVEVGVKVDVGVGLAMKDRLAGALQENRINAAVMKPINLRDLGCELVMPIFYPQS